MRKTIFWDVDTQWDFIRANGLLAVPGAEGIVPQLERLTRFAHEHEIRIVATADDHDTGHAEITTAELANWKTTFPPHCMRGTPGQRKIVETALRDPLVIEAVPVDASDVSARVAGHGGDVLLNKPGLDVFRWNPAAHAVLATLRPERVVVYGVATDFCVAAAVEGIRQAVPNAELVVVNDAIAAIDGDAGSALCSRWSERGIIVTDTDSITR